jgi:aldehyde:ferredoxin oxidoreductase
MGDGQLQVASIGPAGENQVRFACIENGPYGAWARTGLGAVMGSKNLKAVAVRGRAGIKTADKNTFLTLVKEAREALFRSPFYETFKRFGTMNATVPYARFGALPGRNFQTGVLAGWEDTRTRKLVSKYSQRGIACISCPIACGHWTQIKEGPFSGLCAKDMEVTPVFGFGAGCDVENLPSITYLMEICQSLGMDAVSASATVAFAAELFQRGIITEKDLGFPLVWGDVAAIEMLLKMIAFREGLGDILAEGTWRAGKIIPGASEYAMHVKGLELPLADPRGRWSTWTFGYLTNVR